MHTHSKHLHPQRRRRIARNLSAHRKPLAPALKAPKVIVLLGVLCGHHDALLGWTKISVFERGDAPAPEHRGARRAVGRSSRGAWAVRICGHATHWRPRVNSGENGEGLPSSARGCSFSSATWTRRRRISFHAPAPTSQRTGPPPMPRTRGAPGQNSVAACRGGAGVDEPVKRLYHRMAYELCCPPFFKA